MNRKRIRSVDFRRRRAILFFSRQSKLRNQSPGKVLTSSIFLEDRIIYDCHAWLTKEMLCFRVIANKYERDLCMHCFSSPNHLFLAGTNGFMIISDSDTCCFPARFVMHLSQVQTRPLLIASNEDVPPTYHSFINQIRSSKSALFFTGKKKKHCQ